jgi:putative transposase
MRTNYPHHLSAFDYVGCHRYFLTFCCDQRVEAFTDHEAVRLVWSHFLRTARDECFSLFACCFMPDHAHLVVEGLEDKADLKRFISRSKQSSGYYYKQKYKKKLWQRYGYERVLRGEESTRAVAAYVLENPVRAGLAKTVYEYPYVLSSLCSREELIEFVYRSDGPAEAGHYDRRSA